MLWVIFCICYVVDPLSRSSFGSVLNSATEALVIFPHFQDLAGDELKIFKDFSASLDLELNIATAVVDCLSCTSFCSRLRLVPGKVYVLVRPSNWSSRLFAHRLDEEALKKAHSRISTRNVLMDLKSVEEIRILARNSPLFLLAARSNAGDLAGKLKIFEQVAMENLLSPLNFALVTNPLLYEQFAEYPFTSLVYVNPLMRFAKYDGNFSLGEVRRFVDAHAHHVFSEVLPRSGIAFVRFGHRFQENPGLGVEQANVFVNVSERWFLGLVVCGWTSHCSALVDFDTFRMVRIDEMANASQAIRAFMTLWGDKLFLWRFLDSVIVMGWYLIDDWKMVYGCGTILLLLSGVYFVELLYAEKKHTRDGK
jgi:hypothetical protein